MAKAFETFAKNTLTANTPSGARAVELAAKHNIAFASGKFSAGCPGIVSPRETVDIELQ